MCSYFGQEISFSDLLIPSKTFGTKPKRLQSESLLDKTDSAEKTYSPHAGVARCFSYDPATHKATAHYLPTGKRLNALVSGYSLCIHARELTS